MIPTMTAASRHIYYHVSVHRVSPIASLEFIRTGKCFHINMFVFSADDATIQTTNQAELQCLIHILYDQYSCTKRGHIFGM